MARTTQRRTAPTALTGDARSRRLLLAQLDQDQADLERARDLLQQARILEGIDPREGFELVHRAALRGAGVLVARANRSRRRRLPLNVWTALEKLGGEEAERAEALRPLVAERSRLDRDAHALPAPELLRRHLEETSAHLDHVARELVAGAADLLADPGQR